MVKQVMTSDAEGIRCGDRPKLGWMNGVRSLRGRGISVEQGRQMYWIGKGGR